MQLQVSEQEGRDLVEGQPATLASLGGSNAHRGQSNTPLPRRRSNDQPSRNIKPSLEQRPNHRTKQCVHRLINSASIAVITVHPQVLPDSVHGSLSSSTIDLCTTVSCTVGPEFAKATMNSSHASGDPSSSRLPSQSV